MPIPHLSLATEKSADTGEAEYWIGPIREFGEAVGFELFDFDRKPIAQFLYQDSAQADVARAAMFTVLEQAILVSAELPQLN